VARAADALLDAGADIDARDKRGLTPLMWAAAARHRPCLDRLLLRAADPGVQDRQGRTALTWCASNGPGDLYVKRLLLFGSTVTLMDALLMQARERARRLLSEAPDLRSRGPYGETPLMRAAELGDVDLVRELLRLRAPVDARDDAGNTALFLALGGRPHFGQIVRSWGQIGPREGRDRLIEVLAAGGVDVNARNRAGCHRALVGGRARAT
jgi:uncharacterized protein